MPVQFEPESLVQWLALALTAVLAWFRGSEKRVNDTVEKKLAESQIFVRNDVDEEREKRWEDRLDRLEASINHTIPSVVREAVRETANALRGRKGDD